MLKINIRKHKQKKELYLNDCIVPQSFSMSWKRNQELSLTFVAIDDNSEAYNYIDNSSVIIVNGNEYIVDSVNYKYENGIESASVFATHIMNKLSLVKSRFVDEGASVKTVDELINGLLPGSYGFTFKVKGNLRDAIIDGVKDLSNKDLIDKLLITNPKATIYPNGREIVIYSEDAFRKDYGRVIFSGVENDGFSVSSDSSSIINKIKMNDVPNELDSNIIDIKGFYVEDRDSINKYGEFIGSELTFNQAKSVNELKNYGLSQLVPYPRENVSFAHYGAKLEAGESVTLMNPASKFKRTLDVVGITETPLLKDSHAQVDFGSIKYDILDYFNTIRESEKDRKARIDELLRQQEELKKINDALKKKEVDPASKYEDKEGRVYKKTYEAIKKEYLKANVDSLHELDKDMRYIPVDDVTAIIPPDMSIISEFKATKRTKNNVKDFVSDSNPLIKNNFKQPILEKERSSSSSSNISSVFILLSEGDNKLTNQKDFMKIYNELWLKGIRVVGVAHKLKRTGGKEADVMASTIDFVKFTTPNVAIVLDDQLTEHATPEYVLNWARKNSSIYNSLSEKGKKDYETTTALLRDDLGVNIETFISGIGEYIKKRGETNNSIKTFVVGGMSGDYIDVQTDFSSISKNKYKTQAPILSSSKVVAIQNKPIVFDSYNFKKTDSEVINMLFNRANVLTGKVMTNVFNLNTMVHNELPMAMDYELLSENPKEVLKKVTVPSTKKDKKKGDTETTSMYSSTPMSDKETYRYALFYDLRLIQPVLLPIPFTVNKTLLDLGMYKISNALNNTLVSSTGERFSMDNNVLKATVYTKNNDITGYYGVELKEPTKKDFNSLEKIQKLYSDENHIFSYKDILPHEFKESTGGDHLISMNDANILKNGLGVYRSDIINNKCLETINGMPLSSFVLFSSVIFYSDSFLSDKYVTGNNIVKVDDYYVPSTSSKTYRDLVSNYCFSGKSGGKLARIQ